MIQFVRQMFQLIALMLVPLSVLALPYNALDARSMALGGAGVAAANSTSAATMNPALLIGEGEQGLDLLFPVIGVRYRDPDNMLDSLDSYQSQSLEIKLSDAVDAFNEEAGSESIGTLFNAARQIWINMNKFSRAPIHGEMFGGLVVAMPSPQLAKAFSISSWTIAGGQLNVTEGDLEWLNTLLTDAQEGSLALATNAIIEEHLNRREQEESTEDNVDEEEFKTIIEQFDSTMKVRGMAITEFAFSFAQKVEFFGYDFSVGVTPKYVKVTAFDYAEGLDDAHFITSTNAREHSNINFDFGLARDYGNGWRSGFTIKNLIQQNYSTGNNSSVEIEPQFRAGLSLDADWFFVTADLDLLENAPAGYEEDTQFLSLGGELELSDMVTMRAGYRYNMSKPETSLPSLGLGLDLGVRVDLAVAATEDDITAALQFAYSF